MHGLFPIIRRVRRPLVAVDVPPVVGANIEPVNAVSNPAHSATEANLAGDASTASVPQEETD